MLKAGEKRRKGAVLGWGKSDEFVTAIARGSAAWKVEVGDDEGVLTIEFEQLLMSQSARL